MRRYMIIDRGYILAVGTGTGGTEISEAEYSEILSFVRNKPSPTDTTDYRLREDLTWEAYEVDPPDPDPEIEDAEVYDILFGGVE